MSRVQSTGIPVDIVLAVFERWTSEDPERNTQTNAAAQTGLDTKWFRRLVSEPNRDVPFESVDQMVTGLGLQHEWPLLMGAEDPAELDTLDERLCRTCNCRVFAESKPPFACVWCGSKTRKAPPRKDRDGPNNMTAAALHEAKRLYDTPMTMRQVARLILARTNYASLHSCEQGLRTAFKAMRWPTRGFDPGVNGFKVGQVWRVGSEELLLEARQHYEAGYNLTEVANIMWPRLDYTSPHQAAKSWARAMRARGWKMRDRSAARKGRGTTHGMYARGDDEGVRQLRRDRYNRDRRECQHDGCSYLAGGHDGTGHPDFCRRHDPNAHELADRQRRQRNLTRGYVQLQPLRPVLVAWKGQRGLGGLSELSRRSGVPVNTLTRWLNRCPDEQLIRPDYAEAVRAVGLPDEACAAE